MAETEHGNSKPHTEDRGASGKLAAFFPGYFALVMATGVVSLACHFQGWQKIALGLLGLNTASYLTLWFLTSLRLLRFRRQFVDDLTHHQRGAAFLTKAAATCVLGSQFSVLTPWHQIAQGLWFAGSTLGASLSYIFFIAVTSCEPKPSLEAGISGSWLLVIVSIEAISVLGAQVAPEMANTQIILFVSLSCFLCGAMLYVFFATLILYRWIFFSMPPEKLQPDYWIDMGALAITTLAGTELLQRTVNWGFLASLRPFLSGATLFFWATATWWIPLLLAMEAWRHLRGRIPFRYGPEYWALVFPLGMYAVATFELASVSKLTFLNGVATAFSYVAIGAWAVVFTGMLRGLIRHLLTTCHQFHNRHETVFSHHT